MYLLHSQNLASTGAGMALALFVLCGAWNNAQAQLDTIRPSPQSKELQRFWLVQGEEGEGVGMGAGTVGDIDNDGIGDVAVGFGREKVWKVYHGQAPAPDTIPEWVSTPYDSLGTDMRAPLVGDFWGSDQQAVVFGGWMRGEGTPSESHYRLSIYRTDDGRLADTATLDLDLPAGFCPRILFAADLDRDGADELIVGSACGSPEIRIYRGGASFLVDMPGLVIRDLEGVINEIYHAKAGDIDGDSYPDLVTGGEYAIGQKMKIWWGGAGTPWIWGAPDRRVDLSSAHAGVELGVHLLDSDGDAIKDLLLTSITGPRIYRSRSGKSARTRSYHIDDADNFFIATGITSMETGGFPGDSLHRFETTVIFAVSPYVENSTIMWWFSGSPQGPDMNYDAYYSAELDGLPPGSIFGANGAVLDANGDGWDDYIAANPAWPPGTEQGLAFMLTGGEYIPEDPSTGAVDIATADRSDAIRLWPNPARDAVTIAWRGDLRRMPKRFIVHDMLGAEIASGDVEPGRGAMRWECEDVAPGVYVVSVFDGVGEVIGVGRVVRK